MDDEIRIDIPVELSLDSDGFVRRECPTCEAEFKWFSHAEDDHDAERVNQYFCPLCGAPAGVDNWWTQAQVEHGRGLAGPEMEQAVADAISDVFKGMKGITFKPNSSFSLDIEPTDPLHEPDDMVIVEPPCHPNEPLKVPEDATGHVHCLICGTEFAA
jgi:ribosomal protein S27E